MTRKQQLKNRVYTRFVWQWVDGVLREVPEEARWYEYQGPVALASAMFTPSATAYRFYNDDGSESASTALAAQDTAATLNLTSSNNKVVLRWRVQETAGASGATTDDFTLQFWPTYTTGATNATSVTTSTNKVKAYDSTNLTDGAATTQRLTSGTGSFIAGEIGETGTVIDYQLTASNYTELVYTVQIDDTQFGDGDSVNFRLIYSGSPINTSTATLNISKTGSAFGSLLTTGQSNGTDIAASNDVTVTSASVSVGDLIVALCTEQTALTASGASDNLGNTYSAADAGLDVGAVTQRMFYSRVTSAGTLTTVTVTATASADNFSIAAMAFKGPFADPPLDKIPTQVSDATSPFDCPSTGTLTQADELVIGWMGAGGLNLNLAANSISATSPGVMLRLAVESGGGVATSFVQGWVVSATTAVAPQFTGTTNPTTGMVGTASFKKATSGAQDGKATFPGSSTLSAGVTSKSVAAATIPGSSTLSTDTISAQRAAASFIGSGSFSVDTIVYSFGSATFGGLGNLSIDAQKTKIGEATFGGAGSLSITANLRAIIAATFAGASSLSANTISAQQAQATFEGAGNFSADTVQHGTAFASATFNGSGTLQALAVARQVITTQFDGGGVLSVTARLGEVSAATFGGLGSLSVDTQKSKPAAATFGGSGTLSVDATQVSGGAAQQIAATFGGAGNLSAQVTAGYLASVQFTGTGNLLISVVSSEIAASNFAGAGFASFVSVQSLAATSTFGGADSLSVGLSQGCNGASSFAGSGSLSANAMILTANAVQATFSGGGEMAVNVVQIGPRRVRTIKAAPSPLVEHRGSSVIYKRPQLKTGT